MCFWRPHSLPSQSGDAPLHKSQSSTRQEYRPNRSYIRTLGPLSRLSASKTPSSVSGLASTTSRAHSRLILEVDVTDSWEVPSRRSIGRAAFALGSVVCRVSNDADEVPSRRSIGRAAFALGSVICRVSNDADEDLCLERGGLLCSAACVSALGNYTPPALPLRQRGGGDRGRQWLRCKNVYTAVITPFPAPLFGST